MVFTCFCASVRCGPIRVTGGLGTGGNAIPNVHPNTPATSCVEGVLSEVALVKTVFLTIVTVIPLVCNTTSKVKRVSVNNASVVVMINITLRAIGRLRSRVVVHRCGNFLSWLEGGRCGE